MKTRLASCGLCGAVVAHSNRQRHVDWHAVLLSVVQQVENLAQTGVASESTHVKIQIDFEEIW